MLEILDRLRQEDDSAGDDPSVGDDGDDMFVEGGDDGDLGDLGGLDDFDDGGFDDMGGDEGGGDVGELRNRVDELENEVSSLSSTVNTVRSENQEISETADEIEENVRKLLDIYEMVTRGVNPFVDDVSHEQDFGTGSLGLFDAQEEETQREEEELDSSVTDADAEDFFDDDFVDDDAATDAVAPAGGGSSSGGSGGPAGGQPAQSAADGGGGDDTGKSFAELKEEYENDEADWADDVGDDLADEPDEPAAQSTGDDAFDAAGDGFEIEDGWNDGPGGESMANGETAEVSQPAPEPVDETSPTDDAAADRSAEDPPRTEEGDLQFAENTLRGSSGLGSKPYVTDLPSGYVSDLIVMEWLEYLVAEGGTGDAARAVNYYAAIEWIGEDVEESLLTFLRGFGDFDDPDEDDRPTPSGLTMGHHAQSLQYISRLASATSEMVVLNQWMSDGGGIGGIQR